MHHTHTQAQKAKKAKRAKGAKKVRQTKAQKVAQHRNGLKWAAAGQKAIKKILAHNHGHLPARLSPGDIACCAAEAAAASLRLHGVTVDPEDMLSLYWAVADGPHDGADIGDILHAARHHGLAGWHPDYTPLGEWQPQPGMILVYRNWEGADTHAATIAPDGTLISWGEPGWDVPDEPPDQVWAVNWDAR